jgi:hypothetical protein
MLCNPFTERKLQDVRVSEGRQRQAGGSMKYKFTVPDTSSVQPRPADLVFPDRIPKMKARVCMTCSGKVEEFDRELSQKKFLISGMCQKCQEGIFGASEEDFEEICMVTFG